ncbi:MAG: MATE family efflux transporter [Oscillospiraceae bacterium]|nr:MATE family efflux transporter [Oscillospiraceae bacterium]
MENLKQEKMAVMPIRKLMLSMGIPMILSMVLQAVYNIVDSVFVSNMPENGEAALNALTLAFPAQMLMVAVGIGTGVGVNVLVAKSLGQGDRERAGNAAGNGIFMAIMICIAFLLFGMFGVRAYISSQTDNGLIKEMAAEYLQICCMLSFGIVFFSIYEKLLQSTGHSICSTIAQISGAAVNMILDPIMIYGLLGCPAMGVRGAAYATVIGQIVSFGVALLLHLRVNKVISNRLCYLKPSLQMIRLIYAIGLPAIIAQALMSVMTYGLNIILGSISESMVTAYGLFYKIQQFLLFAAFGMRDAIMPITAFNFGMGSKRRVDEAMKYGMVFTLVIMLAGTLALELFAEPFSVMFGLSGETHRLCVSAMRIISLSFVFAGANVVFQGIFQALDGGAESLVISLCRQLLFIFPLTLLFAHYAKVNLEYTWTVWIAFPITEILSVIISIILFQRIYRNKIASAFRNNNQEAD